MFCNWEIFDEVDLRNGRGFAPVCLSVTWCFAVDLEVKGAKAFGVGLH